ncbi:MAG TPA: ankyrin repeat domain-containing protein [Pyrinomonadaceae bacterium]|jgi:hypothetical protein
MKRCTTCSRVYADEEMRFCLDDGALLVESDTASSSPETMRIPPPKGTGSMRTEVWRRTTAAPDRQSQYTTPESTRKTVKLIIIVAAVFVVSLIITKVWVIGYGDSELLYQAANSNNVRVKLLLLFGANVDARDEQRGTALMGAAYRGQGSVAKTLLDNRASLNLRNNQNETALMLAAKRGNEDVIKVLLEKDPELNTKDDKGWTALMWAAWGGHEEAARLLLKAGADQRVTNNLGETALFLATKRSNSGVQKLLSSSSNNY